MIFKKPIIFVAGIVFFISMTFIYSKYISPTRIALINFRDFQYSTFLEVNDNPFIRVERVKLNEDKRTRMMKYDVIYVFGMGLHLNEIQSESIQLAISKGVKVYSYAATSAESDLTNIVGDDLDFVEAYFSNGGRRNTERLLNYTRKIIDGKNLFTKEVEPPITIPLDVFFHIGDDNFFRTYDEFQKWYIDSGHWNDKEPRVAVVATNIGPRNANRGHVDELILQLESRNLNVYPISGFGKRMEFLEKIDPDLVVLLPHGRFAPGNIERSIEWLKEKNIPLIVPLTVFEPYQEWLTDQQGMSGGMLSQSIVVPELDGGIYPYVFGAQFKNERGLYTFRGIPGRTDKLAELIKRFINLSEKPNSEKKIAVYYYKGPGANAMVAGGMEVAPSLLNFLRTLKEAGYETGELPSTGEELIDMIQRDGPVLGAYAKGSFKRYLDEGDPELVSKEDYLEWCRAHLAPEMYKEIVRDYGEAPGEYMSVINDDGEFLAVARVQFGNVVLLPQPLPAYGENEFQIIHGAKKAPPHAYVVSYLWSKHGFKSDAIVHFGTHGSLEFTPWKQSALSEYDWPDALIGGMPHFYVYVVNNVGEAVIAKRRSYATIISHLTPPFTESGLYGELNDLHDRLHHYLFSEDDFLKDEYLFSIKTIVLENDLHRDMGLDALADMEMTPDIIDKIHNYIHVIEQEKITSGLYTLGETYTREEAYETALLMAVDALAYSQAKLDILKGDLSSEQMADSHYFDAKYRQRAFDTVDKILNYGYTPGHFLTSSDMKMLSERKTEDSETSSQDFMANMMELAGSGTKNASDIGKRDAFIDNEKIKDLVLEIAPDREKREFLISLKDETKLNKAFMVLDPGRLSRAERVARFIPEMQKVIDIGKEESVQKILALMRDSEVRQKIFEYFDDTEVLGAIRKEENASRGEKINRCIDPEYTEDLFLALKSEKHGENMEGWEEKRLSMFRERLSFYLDNYELYPEVRKMNVHDAEAVSAAMRSVRSRQLLDRARDAAWKISEKRRQERDDMINALATYEETLYSIQSSFDGIKRSTQKELESLVNALDGGYILPSSGGDPIANPASVPTGRNIYSIDAERTPTEEAWRAGKRLAKMLIETKLASTGKYPRKAAFTLWGGEFIRDQGTTLAQIFYLLGVEPVRNSRGIVHDVSLIPSSELKRPRIDVVVQTSGQFRDVAASRIFLVDRAVKIASEAGSEEYENYVLEGTLRSEEVMKEKGFSPMDARTFSTARVFGGVNGNYGTGIMGLVESGDIWEDDSEISDQYLKNMGAVYTANNWGHYREGIFEASLQGADTVVHPRSSNVWGPLSLDHVYEFMGGISATIRNVTGNDPDAYFTDLRNRHNPGIQDVKEAIWIETRSTLFNPKYITALQEGGASSAAVFAETFRNTYGWNVMKPNAIDKEIWEGLYDIYIEDKYDLNMEGFFKSKNPYALQEMTAVMLETIRKGYWEADEGVIETVAELHARLVKDHGAGCSGFVCDNAKLRKMIAGAISHDLREPYQNAISESRVGEVQRQKEGMKLEKQIMTLDDVRELVKENIHMVFFILVIVGVFSFAIVYGGYKQRT